MQCIGVGVPHPLIRSSYNTPCRQRRLHCLWWQMASAVWEIDGGVVGPKVGKGQTGLVIPIFCFHCSAIWWQWPHWTARYMINQGHVLHYRSIWTNSRLSIYRARKYFSEVAERETVISKRGWAMWAVQTFNFTNASFISTKWLGTSFETIALRRIPWLHITSKKEKARKHYI